MTKYSKLHDEWSKFHYLARWLCRRKLIRLDGSMPQDIDDRVDEAIAHAWKLFPKLRIGGHWETSHFGDHTAGGVLPVPQSGTEKRTRYLRSRRTSS